MVDLKNETIQKIDRIWDMKNALKVREYFKHLQEDEREVIESSLN